MLDYFFAKNYSIQINDNIVANHSKMHIIQRIGLYKFTVFNICAYNISVSVQ